MADVQNATYNFKAVPEASWYALGATIGGIFGALLGAFTNIDSVALAAIVAAITPLPRVIVGVLLPFPETKGPTGDKSS